LKSFLFAQANGDVAISMDQSLLMQRDMTDDFLYSRANAMQNIESTIVELGGIFQQLAHMIKGLRLDFLAKIREKFIRSNSN
jgi:hypothetical protein